MPIANITFFRCVQDSQEAGSDDEHMISRLFYTLEIDGNEFSLYADIKQTVGSDYETAPLEVSFSVDYKGSFNYECFRQCAEKYYRSLVGSSVSGIRIQGGGNIRMKNNTFEQTFKCECEVTDRSEAW